MTELHDVATALGLGKSTSSPIALAESIHQGLPVAALDRVSAVVAPRDSSFRFQIVPKATLSRRRRKPSPRLSPAESNVVARIARVWAVTRRVFGADETARDFLSRPHPLLENRVPLKIALDTELGAHLVVEVLGRLEHGTAA